MPRITSVYTRTGDDGTTGLGNGGRVRKTSLRIAAFGAVDEVNSHIGAALAAAPPPRCAETLRGIQNELFHLGADLCVPEADKRERPGPVIEQRHIDALEALMDRLSESLQPLSNFLLPGGTAAAALLHVARAVCRRAERDVLALADVEAVNPLTFRYLNRLSDALFVMARHENQAAGVSDPLWNSRA